jgi:hypothetical protein
MLALVTSALALRVPPSGSRRAILAGGGAILAGSSPVAPAAAAGLPFGLPDPIGAYGGGKAGDVNTPVKQGTVGGKPNSGILLLRELFDGGTPEEGIVEWYEKYLSSDFKATFGKIVLNKEVRYGYRSRDEPYRLSAWARFQVDGVCATGCTHPLSRVGAI